MTAETLEDRLAAAVEAFNASNDPVERVELHETIIQLRRKIHESTT